MKYSFDIEKIKYSNDYEVRKNELKKFVEFYFQKERPKYFIKYEEQLTEFIPDIMSKMSFEELLYIVPNYYQFCYTVTIEKKFIESQKKISNKLLKPFSKILLNKINELNVEPLKYKLEENNYLIICRHALTQGMYAPGKAIFSIVSGLLKNGKNVLLVSLGSIDRKFIDLKKKFKNLNFLVKEDSSTFYVQLINLRKICKNLKPVKIITEMPVNICTALYYSKISSKVIYWSPGFTHVPWFDKVLLVPEIVNEKLIKNEKFIEIPESINFDLLRPKVDVKIIEDFKNKYFIKKSDFVIGTFARYELISKSYIELVIKILEADKNRKIIIAGTNDRSFAYKMLKKFVNKNQAIILGFSNIHILGNCCNVFLDTIPYPCGFSAIEIMAKGKPVMSINSVNMDNYKKSRISELIFKNDIDLIDGLIKLQTNNYHYKSMSQKSIEIAKNFDNEKKLIDTIISI